MTIVTISRGSASGGLQLAQGLADKLGFRTLSREDLVHEASAFGAPEAELQDALLRPPGFFDRLKHERRRYLAFVQAVLAQRVQAGDIIYHGNAGHLLLRGVSHVLCIRLIAPAASRVRLVMERQGVPHDDAVRLIEQQDHQRQRWTKFLYGVDPLDPSLYDLTINLVPLTMEGAVEVAAAAARRPEFQPTEQSRKAMADLVLASKVRAALAADSETAPAEVEVRADDGVIHLAGKLRPDALVAAVLRIAGRVEGVRQVERERLDAPDLGV